MARLNQANLASLLSQVMARQGYTADSVQARKRSRQNASRIMKLLARERAEHACLWRGNRLEAIFAIYPESNLGFFSGRKGLWGFQCVADPVAPRTLDFLAREIRSRRARISKLKFDGALQPGCEKLLREFTQAGIYIDAGVFCGETQVALRRLDRSYPELKENCWPEGVQVRRINRRDFGAAKRLLHSHFKSNPQHGWFVADRAFLDMLEKEWREDLKRERPLAFVLEQNGRLVGQIDCAITHPSAFGKKTASLALCLAPHLQGKGIAKYAYRFLLKRLCRERVHYFGGRTAQPGVIHLSERMGRSLVRYELRSGKPSCEAKRFLRYGRKS